MYLSPLTWGTNDILADFHYNHNHNNQSQQSKQQNFKQNRKSIAKQRNDDPKFVKMVNEVTAAYPPAPYMPNPLATVASNSKLGDYVSNHFLWNEFPEDVDIGIGEGGQGGQLPSTRVVRKRQQLENIMAFAIPFIHQQEGKNSQQKNKTVVDFCCGCGHQSIPLAYLFPMVNFILIDTNNRSLDIARGRVKRLNLSNVKFILGNIQNFNESFDVGLSLHACGVATDIAIQKSVEARAVYISIPCCVGKIAHHESDRDERSCGDITYPRSQEYSSVGCSLSKYLVIAKAADFGHHGFDDATQGCDAKCDCSEEVKSKGDILTDTRRLAKRVIEQDRNFYARRHNYRTFMTLCYPVSCTPKNDIIIGIPDDKQRDVDSFESWTRDSITS